MDLSFEGQCSLLWVRVSRDSSPYFTVSDSRLPKPGRPGPHLYIPQERGGAVISPDAGLPFLRLLRLAGLRWRWLDLPPHGIELFFLQLIPYIPFARIE
jgi:hypothetical protein